MYIKETFISKDGYIFLYKVVDNGLYIVARNDPLYDNLYLISWDMLQIKGMSQIHRRNKWEVLTDDELFPELL